MTKLNSKEAFVNTDNFKKIKKVLTDLNIGEEPYYENKNGSPIFDTRTTTPLMVIYDSDLVFAPSNSLVSSENS